MSDTTTTTPIYLDADDYDALERSAEKHDGIGSVHFLRDVSADTAHSTWCPNCVHGHAIALEFANETLHPMLPGRPSRMRARLDAAGLTTDVNDRIIGPQLERVSWAEYVKRGHIVRREPNTTTREG